LRGENKLLNQFIESIRVSFCADHANNHHMAAVEPVNDDMFFLERAAPVTSLPEFWESASWTAFREGGEYAVCMAHQLTVKGIGFFRAGETGNLCRDFQQ
jgi:hypothetical protein